jgi:streptogramin lyase
LWTDLSPVPSNIVTTGLVSNATTDPLEAEAARAAQHFGYDANATYSIVAGLEYAEVVTNPGNISGFQDAWNDATGRLEPASAWRHLEELYPVGATGNGDAAEQHFACPLVRNGQVVLTVQAG